MGPTEAFTIRCVVHLVRPTGTRATTLDELRHAVSEASDASLFYHCLQYQLRNPASKELPPDDLSAWVGGVVQDRATAERMSFTVSSHNRHPGELRPALLKVLEEVPASQRANRMSDAEGAFVFLEVEPVTLPTGLEVQDDAQTVEALTQSDVSVWFYHVLEQPWFGTDRPTLHEWLEQHGEHKLAHWLTDITNAGLPIEAARERLLRRWRNSHLGRRLGDAAEMPDEMRREAGREVVGRLVRRMRKLESHG
jgi:hypothetical protein